MGHLKIFSVVFTILSFSLFSGCASSPEQRDISTPIACLPRSVSVELGQILVERARELPRREQRNVCSFVEDLCIDLSTAPCRGDQVACLTWRGRDPSRACNAIEISADLDKADLTRVYQWFVDLILGR